MSAANSGTIVGTIVTDITTRVPNNSLQVTQFRVAPVDSKETESPIPLTAYNGVGQKILQRYNKGDTVAIEYRLRYTTWQTPEGEPRGRMEVVVVSTTTIRLGQLSIAQRAERTAAGQSAPATEPVEAGDRTAAVNRLANFIEGKKDKVLEADPVF
jgi:single-stranded DNA-binding protein